MSMPRPLRLIPWLTVVNLGLCGVATYEQVIVARDLRLALSPYFEIAIGFLMCMAPLILAINAGEISYGAPVDPRPGRKDAPQATERDQRFTFLVAYGFSLMVTAVFAAALWHYLG